MDWRDAIEADGDGCALLLEARAGAKSPVFPDGYNEWRGRIGIRVHAPAEHGRANEEIKALVAKVLRVPPARVTIEAGGADTRKRVAVAGLSRDDAVARLAPALGDQ